MHFGLIPRSHRGIFCLNELPDLSPKIQVGLFNVLEERDIQIRGFPVRLPLDLCLVFSANPEDYTNRGRIVTPLKDRIGSVIRTHYPKNRDIEIEITEQNAWVQRKESNIAEETVSVQVPQFMKEILAEVARLSRTSPHVNQASGVSVRMAISNYENAISNAERRSVLANQSETVLRLSDLSSLMAGSREEVGQEDALIRRILEEAVKTIFDQSFSPKMFRKVIEYFDAGQTLEVGDQHSDEEVVQNISVIKGFDNDLEKIGEELEPTLAKDSSMNSLKASLIEFILEALYCHNRLNKKQTSHRKSYGM